MPKPGTRKRQPSSTPAHDEPTARKTKGRPKKKAKAAVADPLERLNNDTLNTLLSYLSERDIVRCERLSSRWNQAIKEWVLRFGCRFRFPHAWKPLQGSDNQTRDSTVAAYKREARCQHNIRSGKPRSAFKLESSLLFFTQGNYLAWADPFEINGKIAWQSLEPSEEGVVAAAKTFAVQKYFRAPRMRPAVTNLAVGPDGLLLVAVRIYNDLMPVIRKAVIISPTDEKVLWRQQYGDEWPNNRGLAPFLIGRHWVYCARRNNTSWDLVAYDFLGDKEVYQAPVLTRRIYITQNPDAWDYDQTQHKYRLLQTSNGNDLILELCDREEGGARYVSIINGTSGQFTQKFDFFETSLRYLTPDPGGNYLASVSYVGDLDQQLDAPSDSCLEEYLLMVIRRFFCHDDGHVSPLPADVILTPKEFHVTLHSYEEPIWVVDPYSMAVISFPPIGSNASEFPPRKVCGHPLVPTEDSDLYEAAKKEIQAQLTTEPLSINGCYIVGDAKTLSLPPRPEVGRHRRKPLKFPSDPPLEVVWFLSGGRLLVEQHESQYVINFV